MQIVLQEKPKAPPEPLKYPVIMESRDRCCVKLFVNPTDGVVLYGSTFDRPAPRISYEGCRDNVGELIPATNCYWHKYEGTISLSN